MRLIEAILYLRVFFRAFVIMFVVFFVGYFMWEALKPTPGITAVFTPDYACGVLPELKFPKSGYNVNYKGAAVEVNAPSDMLKSLPPIAYVYRVRYKGETFPLRERLFRIVETLGFNRDVYTNPQPYVLKWVLGNKYLTADTRTGSFLFSLNKTALVSLPVGKIVFLQDAIDEASAVVNGLGLLEGYDSFETQTQPVRYTLQGFVPVDSLAEASMVKVSLFGKKPLLVFDVRFFTPEYRKKVDISKINYRYFFEHREEIPEQYRKVYVVKTVGDDAKEGNPDVYVHSTVGKQFGEKVVRLKYYNWDIEDSPCGTYPLKNINSVVSDIKAGNAYVAYIGLFGGDKYTNPVTLTDITISKVSLAYFVSSLWSEALQPVFVVDAIGYDNARTRYDVVFYVDAIASRGK